ncbi:unnamed protein product [Withania somnifera]
MGIRLPSMISVVKPFHKLQSVVTRNQIRFFSLRGRNREEAYVVPIAYLNHPSFQDLLRKAEEEFGFQHSMGGLTVPCNEDAFFHVTSRLNI